MFDLPSGEIAATIASAAEIVRSKSRCPRSPISRGRDPGKLMGCTLQ
jgi:hypothetical protein